MAAFVCDFSSQRAQHETKTSTNAADACLIGRPCRLSTPAAPATRRRPSTGRVRRPHALHHVLRGHHKGARALEPKLVVVETETCSDDHGQAQDRIISSNGETNRHLRVEISAPWTRRGVSFDDDDDDELVDRESTRTHTQWSETKHKRVHKHRRRSFVSGTTTGRCVSGDGWPATGRLFQ